MFEPGDVVKFIKAPPGIGNDKYVLMGLQSKNWIVEDTDTIPIGQNGNYRDYQIVRLMDFEYAVMEDDIVLVRKASPNEKLVASKLSELNRPVIINGHTGKVIKSKEDFFET